MQIRLNVKNRTAVAGNVGLQGKTVTLYYLALVEESPKKHSCIITSKSIHWLRRRSRLQVILFSALAVICSIERNGMSGTV